MKTKEIAEQFSKADVAPMSRQLARDYLEAIRLLESWKNTGRDCYNKGGISYNVEVQGRGAAQAPRSVPCNDGLGGDGK